MALVSSSFGLPPHLHSSRLSPPRAAHMHFTNNNASTAALAQVNMPPKSSSTLVATHYTHRSKARPIVRATAVVGPTPDSHSIANPPAATPATAAHVLQDVADAELSKRLQSRLATLGIGANTVKVEVRPNGDGIQTAPTATTTPTSRSFTLTIAGKLPVNLGSLFNVLIYGFLKQHPQITSIERRVTFVAPSNSSASSSTSSNNSSSSSERCIDSAPILSLKVKHLAQLLSTSHHAVVYTGDQLLQGSVLPHTKTTTTATTVNKHDNDNENGQDETILSELSAPHPPHLLTKWLRNGTIKHIINENTEGWFNSRSRTLLGGGTGDMMSIDDDQSSVSSNSSCSSISSSSSSSGDHEPLSSEELSEVYGNKFKEICSNMTTCGQTYFRNFEVRKLRFNPAAGQRGSHIRTIELDVDPMADPHLTGRCCNYCNGPLRDTLIDWNETLPRSILQTCITQASSADLSIVFGSSLKVAPTCDMPQLSSPSAPMIIVGPFVTSKDIEALESGGILIRKEPVFVLNMLKKELETLRRGVMMPGVVGSSSSKIRTAKVLKRSTCRAINTTIATNSSATSSSASTSTTSNLSQMRSTSGLTKCWSKSSHPHGQTHAQAANAQTKRIHAHLLQYSQRRHAVGGLDRFHGRTILVSGTSTLSRPSMSRSMTAPCGEFMKLSASLPPFPSLGDEDEVEGETKQMIPFTKLPSRSLSEDQPTSSIITLHANHPTPITTGQGSLLFPAHMSTSSPGDSDMMGLPSLPTVSSPIFLASRGSSLLLSPNQWIGGGTNIIGTPNTRTLSPAEEDNNMQQ